jgi:hypothetical protein
MRSISKIRQKRRPVYEPAGIGIATRDTGVEVGIAAMRLLEWSM